MGFVTRRGNGPWDFMSEGQEGQGRDETMQNAQVYPACSPLAESTSGQLRMQPETAVDDIILPHQKMDKAGCGDTCLYFRYWGS